MSSPWSPTRRSVVSVSLRFRLPQTESCVKLQRRHSSCSSRRSAASAAQTRQTGFDGGRAYEDLRQIVAIGPRPAGSAGAESTRDYIRQQLGAVGLKPQEQSFVAADTDRSGEDDEPPRDDSRRRIAGGWSSAGTTTRSSFADFSFVGANDGGSSTAFLIELGRVLKARKNAVSVELLFLDGEESTGEWQGTDHTYGSRYYVEAARKDGTLKDIRAFILVDMIGDRELLIKRESRSTPWLTEIDLERRQTAQPAASSPTSRRRSRTTT